MSLKTKFKKLMNLHPEAAPEIMKLVDSYTQKTIVPLCGDPNPDEVRFTHEHLEDLFVTAFVMGQTSALDKLRKVEEEIDTEDTTLINTPDDEVEA